MYHVVSSLLQQPTFVKVKDVCVLWDGGGGM